MLLAYYMKFLVLVFLSSHTKAKSSHFYSFVGFRDYLLVGIYPIDKNANFTSNPIYFYGKNPIGNYFFLVGFSSLFNRLCNWLVVVKTNLVDIENIENNRDKAMPVDS